VGGARGPRPLDKGVLTPPKVRGETGCPSGMAKIESPPPQAAPAASRTRFCTRAEVGEDRDPRVREGAPQSAASGRPYHSGATVSRAVSCSSQASAWTVATWRGGKGGLAPAPRSVGEGKPPVAQRSRQVYPIGMLPAVSGSGHAVEGWPCMKQQRELGAGDLDPGGVLLPDEPRAVLHLLKREDGTIGGHWSRHGEPRQGTRCHSAAQQATLPQPT